jgi:amino acid transporter
LAYFLTFVILFVEIASIMVCKGGGYLNYARRNYDEFLETNEIVLE